MTKKESKTKISNAFRAMKAIGISEDKVKPVLKKLLKVYDKNWELIEEENYRALADAIFESEDAGPEECPEKTVTYEATEHPKKMGHNERDDEMEEEAEASEDLERPLKRLRLRNRDPQSPSLHTSNTAAARTPLVRPKEEPDELPETNLLTRNRSKEIVESPESNAENRLVKQGDTSQPITKNKGKLPISPVSPDSRSASHSMRLRDRGKGSVSPTTISKERRPVPERPSHGARLKETRVESGTALSSIQNTTANSALIKPKDEPITDDMPLLEAPLAVIHPDTSNGGDSSSREGTIRGDYDPEPSVLQSASEVGATNGTACPNELRNNDQLAIVSNECPTNLEIASSPSGEVKISLSCDLALQKPGFQMPSLEEVLKSVEDKCLRSYKILDPNFSVMNLMKDMCQCFLELGSKSNNESPETIDVTPAIDLLNKSSSVDALGSRGLGFNSSDGFVDFQSNVKEPLPIPPPLHPPHCNGTDDGTQLNKIGGGEGGTDIEEEENCAEQTNDMSLVVVHQPQVTVDMIRSVHNALDISKGQEKNVIMLVNEVNDEVPTSFHYIPQNAVFQNAHVNFSLACIGDNNCCSSCLGDCLSSSIPCVCAHQTGGEFAYTNDGLVKDELLKECISVNRDPKKRRLFFCKECPLERSKSVDIAESCKGHAMRKFIKECWLKCGCDKQCGNRVVQRGISRNLQVFRTAEGKGWGLRTLEDLPQGAFVCEYAGEVLTNTELFDRVLRSPQREKYSYPVILDADWCTEGELKDEYALCLDATYYGNVARFINHRCFDSNLVEIPVEVETPDRHYYHLALFTTREVKAMEELNWDYGIDFDDNDHPIKPFSCLCGSKFCRNIKRFRSRSAKK